MIPKILEEIRRSPVTVGSFIPLFTGFYMSQVVFLLDFWTINSTFPNPLLPFHSTSEKVVSKMFQHASDSTQPESWVSPAPPGTAHRSSSSIFNGFTFNWSSWGLEERWHDIFSTLPATNSSRLKHRGFRPWVSFWEGRSWQVQKALISRSGSMDVPWKLQNAMHFVLFLTPSWGSPGHRGYSGYVP